MAVKTRFLQISDTVMMEADMVNDGEPGIGNGENKFLYTRLKNGNFSIFSTLDNEFSFGSSISRRPIDEITTLNTIYHYSVPMDPNESDMYSFVDPNAEYIDSSMATRLSHDSLFVRDYAKYCTNPYYSVGDTGNAYFYFGTQTFYLRHDSFKFYLVNGYDFSDTAAISIKLSVNRNDLKKLEICNFFATSAMAQKCVKFLTKPIIFGNNVYDRYIELNPFSLYDMLAKNNMSFFNITPNTSIRLEYAYSHEDNTEFHEIEFGRNEVPPTGKMVKNVECEYSKAVSLKGTIPMENLNSDCLGTYIAENPDSNYLEFYATWNNEALDWRTVQCFNKSIMLYDTSLIKKNDAPYEVDPDYSVESNVKKWIAVHEIECSLMNNNNVLNSETYSMTQVFIPNDDDEIKKFYYRPVIFDTDAILSATAIAIKYTLRFINTEDRVQFTKNAALSLTNVKKFYAKGTNLSFSQSNPFKIYNKIVENKNRVGGAGNGMPRTKYVKVFYESTNILLNRGEYDYANGEYTLQMSQFPKSYKFVFKNKESNGVTKYFDLTNGYYKLYVKNGSENIIVEPTYSKNMNLSLGEVEFNITNSTITKLKNIDEGNRKMSIVSYNADNSISSMFDMNFTI